MNVVFKFMTLYESIMQLFETIVTYSANYFYSHLAFSLTSAYKVMKSNRRKMTPKISRCNSCGKFLRSMTILGRNSVTIGAAILLLFLIAAAISYWQQQFHYFNAAEAGEGECIEYDEGENTIAVNCNASFLDVVQTVNEPEILENSGTGEYILMLT